MRVLVYQLDGKIPNVAVMRIAAHHRCNGDDVRVRQAGNFRAIEPLFDEKPDLVYASLIFESTAPLVRRVQSIYPRAIIGGSGIDIAENKPEGEWSELEKIGIATQQLDYSDYPLWRQSIGFTQRGCRLKCPFCIVPRKEGGIRAAGSIWDIWRGEPWPRQIILLDNDFFGNKEWPTRIAEIRDGKFKVSFNQGINARMLTEETAEAIASVDYRDDSMKVKRIYTAWDSRTDEKRLFSGLAALTRCGVKPDHIMVYILIGYWPNETAADREYRRARLREFGARPYPMPFKRTAELVGFQRWVIGAYDKRIPWAQWQANGYRPEGVERWTESIN